MAKKLEWSKNMIWFGMMIWADLSWSELIFWYFWTGRNHSKRPTSRWFDVFYNFQEWPEGPRWSHELFNGVFFLHCHFGLSFQWARDSWVSGRLQVNNRQQSTFQSFVQSNPAWARAASISSVCGASLCEMIGKRYCVGSCSNNREFDMLCMHIHICTYMYIYVHYVLVSVYIHVYTDYISYMYSDVYICICTCK